MDDGSFLRSGWDAMRVRDATTAKVNIPRWDRTNPIAKRGLQKVGFSEFSQTTVILHVRMTRSGSLRWQGKSREALSWFR